MARLPPGATGAGVACTWRLRGRAIDRPRDLPHAFRVLPLESAVTVVGPTPAEIASSPTLHGGALPHLRRSAE
jgi:hypothetical protein